MLRCSKVKSINFKTHIQSTQGKNLKTILQFPISFSFTLVHSRIQMGKCLGAINLSAL